MRGESSSSPSGKRVLSTSAPGPIVPEEGAVLAVKAALEDGSSFFLPYTETSPGPGEILSPEIAEEAMAFEALRKGYALCARAEQSSGGLALKLAKRGFASGPVRFAVAELERLGVVDDFRFAASYLHSRVMTKPESLRHLTARLRARGVPGSRAREAVAEFSLEWGEERLFNAAAEKTLRKEPAKFVRRMASKGFSTRMAEQYLESHHFDD